MLQLHVFVYTVCSCVPLPSGVVRERLSRRGAEDCQQAAVVFCSHSHSSFAYSFLVLAFLPFSLCTVRVSICGARNLGYISGASGQRLDCANLWPRALQIFAAHLLVLTAAFGRLVVAITFALVLRPPVRSLSPLAVSLSLLLFLAFNFDCMLDSSFW